jgi:Chaperone of endosialidase
MGFRGGVETVNTWKPHIPSANSSSARETHLLRKDATMNAKNLKNLVLGFTLGSFGLAALAVSIPNNFTAGTPISSSQVNANFTALKTAIDTLQTSSVGFGAKLTGSASTEGISVSNAGTGVGIKGVSSSPTLGVAGVLGVNDNTTGQVVGVSGQATASPIGTGVSGIGSTTGGYFQATNDGHSPAATQFIPSAVVANASGATGTVRGVYATANNDGGTGVWGEGYNGGYFVGKAYGVIAGASGDSSKALLVESTGPGSFGIVLLASSPGGPTDPQAYNLITATAPTANGGSHSVFDLMGTGDIHTIGDVYSKGVILTSDRNAKTNFSSVNSLEVLAKVARLPIQRWNYKTDASKLQHIGPMAQDFYAAFGLNGSDNKHISTVDAQGVALAAIQGLNQKLDGLKTENAALKEQLSALTARLAKLEQR